MLQLHCLCSREGTHLVDVRQLREQDIAVNIHLTLESTGTEIQIQTAVVALFHKVCVQRYTTQAGELLRKVVLLAIFGVGFLPLAFLILIEQIFFRRVVGLAVVYTSMNPSYEDRTGKRKLGSHQVRRSIRTLFTIFCPHLIQLALLLHI